MPKPQEISPYHDAIDAYGLHTTWKAICSRVLRRIRPDLRLPDVTTENGIDASFSDNWSLNQLPDLYEDGLAHSDKDRKKSLGQYYTPQDTAKFMASALVDAIAGGKTLVEPCVGCGNLLIETLRLVPDPWQVATRRLVSFDLDETAALVMRTRVIAEFAPIGEPVSPDVVTCRIGDFLTSGFHATDEHVVISNPPYGHTANPLYAGHRTFPTRDLYPLFIEHVIGAHKAAIIVPQGFLGGRKFSCLRAIMSEKAGGGVIPYDNVPATMFNRRKHGTFNTNKANSVRAAIVLSETAKAGEGWHVAPMLRWLAEERPSLFEASTTMLDGTMVVSGEAPWPKVPPALLPVHDCLSKCPRISSLTDDRGQYELRVPSTPRYFVTASLMRLDRTSFQVLRFSDMDSLRLAYLVLNSSVSYCWWRWMDGGITITRSTLTDVPVPTSLTDDLRELADKLIATEPERLVAKMNAGRTNQNLKLTATELDEVTRAVLPCREEHEYQAMAASHANSLRDIIGAWKSDDGTESQSPSS